MKDVTLSVVDRILLSTILPQQGGRIKMLLVQDIASRIAFTRDEVTAYEIRDGLNGAIHFNSDRVQNVEFSLSPEQVTLLKEAVATADAQERITLPMLPLIEKIDAL